MYPPEYTAPKIDETDVKDVKKPISPMVPKHEFVRQEDSYAQTDREVEEMLREYRKKAEELRKVG